MKNSLKYFFIAFLFLANSCSKDDNNENLSGNSSTIKTSITGRILDQNGTAISGATVVAAGKSTTSDIWGIYYLENVTLIKGRDIVRVSYSGKWDQICGFIPSTSRLNYVNVYMNENPLSYSIGGLNGGSLTLSANASVVFPPNAFINSSGAAYTGLVSVKGIQLSPDQPNFEWSAPGGDFIGTRTNGTDELLISYGMVGIKLFDNSGNELKLAPGKFAQITIPIIPSQQSVAPATIPLWYLDESTGKWKEEGVAVKSGNMYTGQVSHFTYWNYDDSRPYFTVSGSVIDCQFIAQPNVYVRVHDQQNNAGGHGCTDIDGRFSGHAPANVDLNIFLNWNPVPFMTLSPQTTLSTFEFTTPFNITSLQNNLCYTNYTGYIKNCNGQPKIAPIVFLDSLNQYLGHSISDANGAFSFSVLQGQVKIVSYSGLFYTSLDTAIYQSQITPIGTLFLCDTINTNNNFQMTFTSVGLGTIPFSFQVNSCSQNFISGNSDIHISYTDVTSNTNSDFHIITPLYQINTFPWDSISSKIQGSVVYNGIEYTITPTYISPGYTTLSQASAIGANIVGTFSGPVTLTGNGLPPLTGILSSSFNIYRDN
jgi:hypothetical protein